MRTTEHSPIRPRTADASAWTWSILLSTDAYSYWDYSRSRPMHHGNSYADRPSRFPHDPAYERMGKDWQDSASVYGPAFTLASETVRTRTRARSP